MGSRLGRTAFRRLAQGYWPTLLLCLAPAMAPAVAAVAAGLKGELQAALAATPDAARGASLYGTCAACHGA